MAISYRFLVRGGTAAALATVNPVPLTRELTFETDTGKSKLGDGVTAWADLDYLGGPGGGSTWRTGPGAPSDSLGVDGDFYLESATGDVYERAAGTYAVALNIKGVPGDDGAPSEIQASATHIQWRTVGGSAWTDIVALVDLKGPPGDAGDDGDDGDNGLNPEFQNNGTHLQWRYVGGSTWTDIVPLIDLTPLSVLGMAFGDETTNIVTGTSLLTFHAPRPFQLVAVVFEVKTAQASGSALRFDAKLAGSSIFSVLPTIDNTEETTLTAATPAVLATTTFAAGDKITVDCNQVGTAGAKGPKMWLIGRWS